MTCFVGIAAAYLIIYNIYGRRHRQGGVTPPYGAIEIHRAVGAGQASPAVCQNSPFSSSNVGMGLDPSAPLAARSALNRAERRAFLRYVVLVVGLHGTVKTVPYKPAGNTKPSQDCAAAKINHPVGAGHAPPAVL